MIDRSKNNIEDVYSLSPLQEGILFHHILDERSTAYFVQAVITLGGEVDAELLGKTFNKVIEKYDILRTVYTYKKSKKPRQVVLKQAEMEIPYKDISHLGEDGGAAFVARFSEEDRLRGFNLVKELPMRAAVLKTGPSRYALVWSFHHIAMDGWCLGIIFKDILRMYRAFRLGESVPREPVTPYKTYIQWLEKQDRDKGLNYWADFLSGYEQQAVLPDSGSATAAADGDAYQPGEYRFVIKEEHTAALNQMAREEKVTVNTVFQALWGVLLQVYNNTDDVVFGAVISNRPPDIEGIEQMIGLFINTLPVRINADGAVPFTRLLRRVHESSVRSRAFQHVSLAEIQAQSSLNRRLIHHIQAFENYPLEENVKEQAGADSVGFSIAGVTVIDRTHYDFNIAVGPGRQWVLRCTYNRAVYDDASVRRMMAHLEQLTAAVVNNPQIPVGKINVLTDVEKQRLLYDLNDTAADFPLDKTIHRLFEEQAARTGDCIAVVDMEPGAGSTAFTYGELNKRADYLAALLMEKGAGPGGIVAVMSERSMTAVIGLTAILKSGAAYLPIAPDTPEARIRYMLADSGAEILLSGGKSAEALTELSGDVEIIYLDNEISAKSILPASRAGAALAGAGAALVGAGAALVGTGAAGLAYVIYTSGSTGTPKGVMIEHRNAVNTVSWFGRSYLRAGGVRVLQMSDYTFDPSVNQVFGSLLHGGELHIVSRDLLLHTDALRRYIVKHCIHVLNFVPQMLKELLDGGPKLESVRAVLSGGEKLDDTVKAGIIEKGYALYNQYGPTETTIDALVGRCSGAKVNLGSPIANARVYIVGRNGRPVPAGVPGELIIGGAGVGRGYLNNPELTAERFDRGAAPLLTPGTLPPTPLYRTGDLARHLPDGDIEFLGRIDHQVKIRGFRIELGEIENRLMMHPAVEDAVVAALESENRHKYLSAYIVARDSREPGPDELRTYLSRLLPEHMVPAHFTQLETIPLTPNGKIDRAALPEPGFPTTSESYVPPGNRVEEVLVEVWQDLLGIGGIGITDNFFQMGGDSIKAIQVVARLKKHGLFLKINDLLSHAQVNLIAPCVSLSETDSTVPQGAVTGDTALTPIQHWFFNHHQDCPHHFNNAVMLFNENGFDEGRLRNVFTALVTHHDALRMVYRREGETVVQENRGTDGPLFQFEVFDLKSKGGSDIPGLIETEADRIQAGIDLAAGPLVRLGLFKTAGGDHLLIVIHHLVVDGVSWRILLEDFAAGYSLAEPGRAVQFPSKTSSFKDWSRRLNEHAAGLGTDHKTRKEIDYWKRIDTADIAPLPRDRNIESALRIYKHTETETLILGKEETETLLRKVNRAYNTEINDILLTALGMTLSQWSRGRNVCIDLEGHGREPLFDELDITRTVGWFTSRYPVVLDMDAGRDISYLIKSVKETLRRIPNRGIGYGLLKYLNPAVIGGETSFHIFPETAFNYLGEFGQEAGDDFIRFSSMNTGVSADPGKDEPFALSVNGMMVAGELKLMFSYNRLEYDADTIRWLADRFRSNLLAVIEHCSRRDAPEATPHDLGYGKISIDDLAGVTRYVRENIADDLEIQSLYPLSPLQGGMFFHALKDDTSTAYFEQSGFTLTGDIDVSLLEESFNRLIARYDIFRTVFVYEALDEPLQVVLKERKTAVFFEDISHLDGAVQVEYLNSFKQRERETGFDLMRDVLMKMSLFKTGPQSYQLVWSFHHILMDGWCLGIVYKELVDTYQCLKEERPLESAAVIPYKHYIDWLTEQDKAEGIRYWETYLEGLEQPAGFPRIAQPSPGESYELDRRLFVLDEDLASRIVHMAAENRVTVNTVFQALWGVLLQVYNNSDDVVFGAVVSGRPPEVEGVETIIGLFINTVPVRITCAGNPRFNRLLNDVGQNAAASKIAEHLSLAEIQSHSPLEGNLINHIMVFENFPVGEETKKTGTDETPGFRVGEMALSEHTHYDFDITVIPGRQYRVLFSFNARVHDPGMVEAAARYFERIARQVADNPAVPIRDIEILSDDEKIRLLHEWNGPEADYPGDKTIHQLFEEQAARTPEVTAVSGRVGGSEAIVSLSYAELNRRSDDLAGLLRRKGAGPGGIIAVMGERRVETVIGLLAILKTGGAYLPVDPDYPEERIRYMMADSGAGIMLNGGDSAWSVELEARDNNTAGLAYVIYTSGTTGVPKGVLIEHRGVVNLLTWFGRTYGLTVGTNVLQMSGYTFDPSVEDVFATLTHGGSLFVGGRETAADRDAFCDFVDAHRIHMVNYIPSLLETLLCHERKLESLRVVICGGERLEERVKDRITERGYRLYNHYGPTEITVDALAAPCSAETAVTLGRPVANTGCYILDKAGRPAPVGVTGELCVSGPGAARGYLNKPELTAERFSGPEKSYGAYGTYRSYKTGDLARRTPDGNIQFLGRRDHQVKIRGLRVELGEIETLLSAHPHISEALAVVKTRASGAQYICAYIVTSDGSGDIPAWEAYAAGVLPAYMTPSAYITLERFPRDVNGKIDRKALPEPDPETESGDPALPQNHIETVLAEIWSDVLGIENVGVRDNFFKMGGDSIKVIQVTARLKKHKLSLKVNDFFENPTIETLAGCVRQTEYTIEQGAVEGDVPLTPIQHWFLESHFHHKHHFNNAVMLFHEAGFEKDFLEKIFSKIVEHHDALRMVYNIKDRDVVQENRGLEGKLFDLEVFDFTGRTGVDKDIEKEAGRIQAGLDLENGPLVKLALFKTSAGDHFLMVIHHLVVDGVSWRILLEDFDTAYGQLLKGKEIVLQEKSRSFKFWADQLVSYAHGNTILNELEYWMNIERATVDVIPADYPVMENERKIRDMDTVRLRLNREDTRLLLTDVHRTYNTEINDILLTALGLALHHWCGCGRVAVNLEGHGREPIIDGLDVGRTVGWFTSLFPVLLDIGQPGDLSYSIKHIKETLRRIPNNGIGYGVLRYLTPPSRLTDISFQLIPPITFNYLGRVGDETGKSPFTASGIGTGSPISPDMENRQALDINGMVMNEILSFSFSFYTNEYETAGIRRLADGYKTALLDIINHCAGKAETELTPSDLGDEDLSLEELDDIQDMINL